MPPDQRPQSIRIPEGCQPIPAAIPPGSALISAPYQGCRYAQPLANGWHPSGMLEPDADYRTAEDLRSPLCSLCPLW
jgi:hypothetical protein